MPRKRVEIILRASDVDGVERRHEPSEGRTIVAHIVVGDDEALAGSEIDSGENIPHLSHRSRPSRLGGDVPDEATPYRGVRREDWWRRIVHYDYFRNLRREPAQIVGKVGGNHRAGCLDGQDVRRIFRWNGIHSRRGGNRRAERILA